jgi:hypothetical protein
MFTYNNNDSFKLEKIDKIAILILQIPFRILQQAD